MAIRFYKGDLIEDANVDIVCHQTNCQGVMCAGIAKQTRDTWPSVNAKQKMSFFAGLKCNFLAVSMR